MTALTTTFVTPDILGPNPTLTAGIEYGKRSLWWTQLEAGKIGQCRYHHLWVQVAEDRMLAGEATQCVSRRRASADWARGPLTPAAATLVRSTLLHAVNAYGFDRLWTEVHRQNDRSVEGARSTVEATRRQLAWAEAVLAVRELYEFGVLDMRPVTPVTTWRTLDAARSFALHALEAGDYTYAAIEVDGEWVEVVANETA